MITATAASGPGGVAMTGTVGVTNNTMGNPPNPLSPTSQSNPNNHHVHHIALDNKRDLTMIRAASTLLQELWDGKLKATLRSFVKKTAQGNVNAPC